MAAIIAVWSKGIAMQDIIEAVENLEPVEGRLEVLDPELLSTASIMSCIAIPLLHTAIIAAIIFETLKRPTYGDFTTLVPSGVTKSKVTPCNDSIIFCALN